MKHQAYNKVSKKSYKLITVLLVCILLAITIVEAHQIVNAILHMPEKTKQEMLDMMVRAAQTGGGDPTRIRAMIKQEQENERAYVQNERMNAPPVRFKPPEPGKPTTTVNGQTVAADPWGNPVIQGYIYTDNNGNVFYTDVGSQVTDSSGTYTIAWKDPATYAGDMRRLQGQADRAARAASTPSGAPAFGTSGTSTSWGSAAPYAGEAPAEAMNPETMATLSIPPTATMNFDPDTGEYSTYDGNPPPNWWDAPEYWDYGSDGNRINTNDYHIDPNSGYMIDPNNPSQAIDISNAPRYTPGVDLPPLLPGGLPNYPPDPNDPTKVVDISNAQKIPVVDLPPGTLQPNRIPNEFSPNEYRTSSFQNPDGSVTTTTVSTNGDGTGVSVSSFTVQPQILPNGFEHPNPPQFLQSAKNCIANGVKESGEECDPLLSDECPQTTFECASDSPHLAFVRDLYGNCTSDCKCFYSNFQQEKKCVVGECGAECGPLNNYYNNLGDLVNPACIESGKKFCGNDCMCGSSCGNGSLDAGEECDASATDGLCKDMENLPDLTKKCDACKCVNKTVCGNGVWEFTDGEICDYNAPMFIDTVLIWWNFYNSSGPPMGECTMGCTKCNKYCEFEPGNAVQGESSSVGKLLPPALPFFESCDMTYDADCDGQIGEGCACNIGENRSCGISSGMLLNVGICRNGTQTCENSSSIGRWGECKGGVAPVPEGDIPDGIDNNCNGYVDECVPVPVPPPVITTTNGLVHRGIYFVNMPVNFAATGTIPAGIVPKPTWEIPEDGFKSTEETFKHTFTTPGQKTITLTLTNAGKIVDEYQIAILVIDVNQAGIFAFINKPFYHQIVSIDTAANRDASVEYSANDSYVISVSASANPCSPSITCLAGNCPLKSVVPASSSCSNLIDVLGGSQGFGKFNFDWTFDGSHRLDVSGLDKASGSINYGSPGDKVIDLLLNYEPSGANMQKQFTREFTLIFNGCSADGNTFYTFDANGRVTKSLDTSTPGVCVGNDGATGTGDDCCPSGNICSNLPTEDPAVTLPYCIYSNRTSCADFSGDGPAICEGQGSNLVVNPSGILEPLAGGRGCGNSFIAANGCKYTNKCSCAWDATETSPDKRCRFGVTPLPDDPAKLECRFGTCLYTAEDLKECKSGYQDATIKATLTPVGSRYPSGDCIDKKTQIPCGRSLLALPFFGLLQFFLALLLIVLLYFAFRKKFFGKKKAVKKRARKK